jgi:SlyX protein
MNRESKSDRERILEAEMALAHLQHDYDSLNEVVLQQQKTIEQLSRKIQKLESKVDASSDPEVRDAESERPPHY